MSANDKPEIMFYHLERSTLDAALPILLEKTLEREWRGVVQSGNPERLASLDSHLWVWRDAAFLPHARVDDEAFADCIAEQPIVLTAAADNPNAAQVLFLIDGAERTEPEALKDFTRCVVIFDGRDADALTKARDYWKTLKDQYPLTYWQETSSKGWEKSAEA